MWRFAHIISKSQSVRVLPYVCHHQAWLVRSRFWTTPLHHVDVLTADRAASLLRAGANLHARKPYYAPERAPTPLDLAAHSESGAAALILEAAEPWSARTHRLWPAPHRAQAVALLHIGHELSRSYAAGGAACGGLVDGGLLDVWLQHVMPLALDRCDRYAVRPRWRRRKSKDAEGGDEEQTALAAE